MRDLSILFFILFLISCAKSPSSISSAEKTINNTAASPETHQEWLQQAKQTNQPITALFNALALAPNTEKPAIIDQLLQQSLSAIQQQKITYTLAELALVTKNIPDMQQLLQQAGPPLSTELKQQQLMLSIALYREQQQAILLIESLFQWLSQAAPNTVYYQEYTTLLWQQLITIPDIVLTRFASQYPIIAEPWLALAQIIRRNTGDPQTLHQRLNQWQKRYDNHPAIRLLPPSFQQVLTVTPYQPTSISVLLPLSQRYRQQALAIRNGMITAFAESNIPIQFFDSEMEKTSLKQALLQADAEFIIGPLLKKHVDWYVLQPEFTALPTLLLNEPTLPVENKHWFYFTLNTNDEIIQAVHYLYDQGIRYPAILAMDNPQGQRQTQLFQHYWQQLLPEQRPLTQGLFSNQQQMKNIVESLLEVNDSRQRIRRIRQIIDIKLAVESRNRKDIDGIYLIANPVQTRLLKPLIDVNTSTFANKIPLYASSKSYSLSNSRIDAKDLNGLTFTETPWMLARDPKLTALRQQFDRLFPQVEEDIQRFYAFGYDAYQLIPKLAQMRVLPALRSFGLTGQLSVSTQGVIYREHRWATYQQNRLQLVQTSSN